MWPCSAGTFRIKCGHNTAISNNVFKIIQNEKIESLMDGGERRMQAGVKRKEEELSKGKYKRI